MLRNKQGNASYKYFNMYLQIALHLTLAQSSNGEPLTTVAAENSTYSSFPFGLIFGNSNGSRVNQQESPAYDNDDEDFNGNKGRAVYWIPTTCDSLAEVSWTIENVIFKRLNHFRVDTNILFFMST
jgi:hypothetical protein